MFAHDTIINCTLFVIYGHTVNNKSDQKKKRRVIILRSIRHFDATIETGGSPVWFKYVGTM